MPNDYGDLGSLREHLRQREEGKLYRHRLMLDSSLAKQVSLGGQEYLAFCSNDYLGLANHPALISAACEGAMRYGVGRVRRTSSVGIPRRIMSWRKRWLALPVIPEPYCSPRDTWPMREW